jgi:tight adherence protein C
MLLAAFDFATILPFAVVGAIAVGGFVILEFFFNRKTRTESRLEQIRNRMSGKATETKDGKSGLMKVLEKASPKMGEALKPKNEREMSKQVQKLSYASSRFRNETAPTMLSTLKMICGIAGFVIGGGGSLLINGVNMYSAVATFVTAFLFMMIPELILSFMASSRKQKLFLGLPDALDLMVVCVEAGLGLDQAMRRVADELERTHPVIGEEFKICNHQLQMGLTREQVLQELGDRNGVEDLKTLSSIMIQVDKFGTSVGKALRTQSDTMRTRRRQMAEEKAAKTAVKLIFPLVLFIFPGIFVVLVGPAAITMINEMLPAFQK